MIRLLTLKRCSILIVIGTIAILTLFWFTKPQTIDQKAKLIEDLGGHAELNVYCSNNGNPFPPVRFTWLFKLKIWLSRPFYKIVYVELRNTEISDDDLAVLEEFDNLIRLDLSNTKFSDNGIKYLEHLEKLKYLRVGGTDLTRAGAKKLLHNNPSLTLEGFDPDYKENESIMERLIYSMQSGTESGPGTESDPSSDEIEDFARTLKLKVKGNLIPPPPNNGQKQNTNLK